MTTAPTISASAISRALSLESIDTLVVLGSGWGTAADALGSPSATCPLAVIPGMTPPSVGGHRGELRLHDRTLVQLGRTHLYENHGVDSVVHSVRTALELGASRVVLTNGCGAANPVLAPGSPVLISDHINLTATTPLVGPAFVDLTEVYSSRLRAVAREVDATIQEGVYAQFRGPQYETPAEVRMARVLGADLVGMSTALEAIEARRLGLEVLGVSLVTNLAAGVSPTPLDHREVLAAGAAAGPRLGSLLRGILERA